MSDLAHEVVVVAIGRPHESRLDADDALEGSFDTAHLGMYFFGRESGEILVSPGVRCNHVTVVVGIFDPLDVIVGIDAPI
jgi:hypothetical protein